MKKVIVCAIALLLVFALVACSAEKPAAEETQPASTEPSSTEAAASTESAGESEDSPGEGIEIAYLINSANDTYENYVFNNAKEYCDANGINLTMYDGLNDAGNQLTQLETVCSNGVDAVIVVPIDTSGDGKEYRAITDKYNVPIVSVVRELKSSWVKVSVDSAKVGKMQAEYVVETLGDKLDIALLVGTLGTEDQRQRTTANHEVFDTYPNIKIVFEESGDWQRDKGMSICENWLQSGTHFDVVVANNDEMAVGAALAIKAAGKTDEIKVFGIDGNESGLEEVKNGTLSATVFQPTDQGSMAVQACIDALNGKYTGEGEPEWLQVAPEVITKDNLDKFWEIIFGEPLA